MLRRLTDLPGVQEYVAHAHDVCETVHAGLRESARDFERSVKSNAVHSLALSVMLRVRPNANAMASACRRGAVVEDWQLAYVAQVHAALARGALALACRALDCASSAEPVLDLARWIDAIAGCFAVCSEEDAKQTVTCYAMPLAQRLFACGIAQPAILRTVADTVSQSLDAGSALDGNDLAALILLVQAAGVSLPSAILSHASDLLSNANKPYAPWSIVVAHALVACDAECAAAVAGRTSVDSATLQAITGCSDAPIFEASARSPHISRDLARFLDEGARISLQTREHIIDKMSDSSDSESDGDNAAAQKSIASCRTADGPSALDVRLLRAYTADRAVFGRSAAVRAGAARQALVREMGLGHEQIEGWAIIFERNPAHDRVMHDLKTMHHVKL